MTEDLDRLTQMLKIIQQNEPGSSTESTKGFANTGLTREQISSQAEAAETEAKKDPAYDFTMKVIDQALADMLPYILKHNLPFDMVMEEDLGLSSFVLKRHFAELLAKTFSRMPENISRMFLENIENGQLLISLITYIATEMVFFTAAASKLAQEVEGHPLNTN